MEPTVCSEEGTKELSTPKRRRTRSGSPAQPGAAAPDSTPLTHSHTHSSAHSNDLLVPRGLGALFPAARRARNNGRGRSLRWATNLILILASNDHKTNRTELKHLTYFLEYIYFIHHLRRNFKYSVTKCSFGENC